jgi:hypothetical protein
MHRSLVDEDDCGSGDVPPVWIMVHERHFPYRLKKSSKLGLALSRPEIAGKDI